MFIRGIDVDKKIIEHIAKSRMALSEPLDMHQLVSDGVLIRKGKSYYIGKKGPLPESVSQRIRSLATTKNGVKVTF